MWHKIVYLMCNWMGGEALNLTMELYGFSFELRLTLDHAAVSIVSYKTGRGRGTGF